MSERQIINQKKIYVKVNVANLHAQPEGMSEVVSQGLYGTPLVLLENGQKKNWQLVKTPDGYQGWMQAAHLIETDIHPATQAKVQSLFAHLYRVEDTAPHPPLMTLPFESPLEILTPEDERMVRRWIKVRLVDGAVAWVQRRCRFAPP